MKVCGDLVSAKKQLHVLQVAYKEHMKVLSGKRLRWLERTIDMQQERVIKLTHLRDEVHPFGCMDCEEIRKCPYAMRADG